MENVNSSVVWLGQTWWLTVDGPMFLLLRWRAAAISLTVHVYTLPPPPSPDQLYQHDKSLRKTDVTSPLPSLFSILHILAYLKPLFSHSGAGNHLCMHLKDTQCSFSQYSSPSYLQAHSPSMTSIPRFLLQDESAVLRHSWFGKPISGQC